jgi:hypothetical protein
MRVFIIYSVQKCYFGREMKGKKNAGQVVFINVIKCRAVLCFERQSAGNGE